MSNYDSYRWDFYYKIDNVIVQNRIVYPVAIYNTKEEIDRCWTIETKSNDEEYYFTANPDYYFNSRLYIKPFHTGRYTHYCDNSYTGQHVVVVDNRCDFKVPDIYFALDWLEDKTKPESIGDVVQDIEQSYKEKQQKQNKKDPSSQIEECNLFYKKQNEKETNQMGNNNFMNGMFGKIESGKCRLTMNGGIAIQTSTGYKTYNMKTGRLTNCSNFVFDIGDDFFFLLPTNKVKKGDIIIVSGKPKCVINVQKEEIKVINFENSTIDTIIPERHIFMGETYMYGKIVSILGQNLLNGKKGTNKIFQMMLLKEMFGKGNNGFSANTGNGMSGLLPFLMMGNNGITDMFTDMFDSDDDEEDNPLSALANLDDEVEDEEDATDEEEA